MVQRLEKTQSNLHVLEINLREAKEKERDTEKSFRRFKTDQARDIAQKLNLKRSYTALNLRSAYEGQYYGEEFKLDDDELNQYQNLFAQIGARSHIPELEESCCSLEECWKETALVLDQTLGDLHLQELHEHPCMLNWVKRGSDYHQQHHQTHCLLCGSKIAVNRLADLDRALTEAKYDSLISRIDSAIATCRKFQNYLDFLLDNGVHNVKSDIAPHLADKFTTEADGLKKHCKLGKMNLNNAIVLLEKKKSQLTTENSAESLCALAGVQSWEAELKQKTSSLNTVIQEHNQAQNELATRQQEAKYRLETHWLAEGQVKYSSLCEQDAQARAEVDKLEHEKVSLERDVERFQQEIRQHRPAADKVNTMLRIFLGDRRLEFITSRDGYRIVRYGQDVSGATISEGEKTAIAFCYFLITLAADSRKLEELIVVVDDPISSLDTRGLHHVVGLIKNRLGKVSQLIIMTHNLGFMNEMKKWLKPKNKNNNSPKSSFLFLEVKEGGSAENRASYIKPMPKLLLDFESEYHYLFSLVYRFEQGKEESEDLAYLMPNAIRKVLEIFMAFKSPRPGGLSHKLQDITPQGNNLDHARILALGRVANLESHAESLDLLTSLSPVNLEETREVARTLLELMKEVDCNHYDEMCRLVQSQKR